MPRRPDYGLDSPSIVAGEFIVGGLAVAGAWATALLHVPGWPGALLRWVGWVAGSYFVLGAASMLFYSKVGKLYIRDQMLRSVPCA